MHHYTEKMTRHIKTFFVCLLTFCLSVLISVCFFFVNTRSLKSSANLLKSSLCLFNTALCVRLGLKL